MSQYVLNLFAKSKIDDVWTQKIFNHSNTSWNETSVDRNKRKFSTVVMQNDKHLEIEESLTHFNNNENWYLDRGIPYKKSFLFYGPPGTGKTSMIKAVSYELQRHIYYLNLVTVKNDNDLAVLLGKINFKECILVIEDIDAQGTVAHDRSLLVEEKEEKSDDTTVDNKSTLSLAGLLNQIDGVQNNHGLMLFMTSNHPKLLDKALVRPGRIDEKVFFGFTTHDQIFKQFQNFYKEDDIQLTDITDAINLIENNLSPATVENAMIRHYKDYEKALEYLKDYRSNEVFEDFTF